MEYSLEPSVNPPKQIITDVSSIYFKVGFCIYQNENIPTVCAEEANFPNSGRDTHL